MLGLQHARILVVESDPVSRGSLLRLLAKAGFDQAGVRVAETAEEAEDRLAEGPADVLLVALRLAGGGNGAEVMSRARAQWPGMARVLMSSFADIERAGDALQSGLAAALVRKPWDDTLLLREVEGALRAQAMVDHRLHMVERALGTVGVMRQQRIGPQRDVPALRPPRVREG
ncbi:MAG: response regulator [Halobacteriales archaeon]|nr:response regulator [Halobacteriales archaeon]